MLAIFPEWSRNNETAAAAVVMTACCCGCLAILNFYLNNTPQPLASDLQINIVINPLTLSRFMIPLLLKNIIIDFHLKKYKLFEEEVMEGGGGGGGLIIL